MTKTKRTLLIILSLIGLALAIELCFVYYNANFAYDAKPSICAISEKMDCDGVAKTSFSQFFGVPLALWGVIFYLFVLFMTFADKLKELKFLKFTEVFKNPVNYIFCVSAFSFIISMILGGISVFKIGSVCIFCFMTYFVDLLIAIVAKTKGISILEEIKISFRDFTDALKIRKYLILFIIVVLLAGAVLTYTSVTNVLAPQIIKQKELKKYYLSISDLADGTRLGPKDADVVIHEYFDFNCAGCFIANLYIHRIVSEFENVAIVQHTLPLDIQCNHNMKSPGHKNSCLKAYYALAAAEQNKYWLISDILFKDGVKDEKDIISEVRLTDTDINKLKEDAHSEKIKNKVQEVIKAADEKNIISTPTLIIGMRQVLGVGSYPEFKKTVIEQGGREKQNNG